MFAEFESWHQSPGEAEQARAAALLADRALQVWLAISAWRVSS